MKTDAIQGRRRVVIDRVRPSIDAGRFPIKRVIGDAVDVEADLVCDGHDHIRAVVRYRALGAGPAATVGKRRRAWREVELADRGNDLWTARFVVDEQGWFEYTVVAWVDHLETWIAGLRKKHDAGVATEVDMEIGAALIAGAGDRAASGRRATADAAALRALAAASTDQSVSLDHRIHAIFEPAALARMHRYPDRSLATAGSEVFRVWVDRERAAFSAWYELFPRSAGSDGVRHGTFADVVTLLPYVARMGFDILYLPPIHPIGVTNRKGANNSTTAAAGDPGSPWAIGGRDGGHTAIHPQLGTLDDFRDLVERTRSYEMELALDIAFQCTPDHPWVTEHPDWFVHRPDGSIQYAENPPKRYEDIYPINFETEDWESLWNALRDVFLYWAAEGVRVFRVDNPHTKAFAFWDWVIDAVRAEYPDAIFLAEAFTRPKRMYRLAKGGYTQSYTYFTWRNDPAELREYMDELTRSEAREFFRPNFWPNTPDILHADLQSGRRSTFVARVVLAATLSANYGLYGPAYELMEHTPVRAGSEEYLDSEKYQIRAWDLERADSLAPVVARLNRIRRENPALHRNTGLRFHACDNPHILCYSKQNAAGDNTILVCVNMDYATTQAGRVEFSPAAVGRSEGLPFVLRDLLADVSYTWHDYWNYIELNPERSPVHVLRIEH